MRITMITVSEFAIKRYKAHNEYLRQKNKSDESLYNRANIYCGCYRTKDFVEKWLKNANWIGKNMRR